MGTAKKHGRRRRLAAVLSVALLLSGGTWLWHVVREVWPQPLPPFVYTGEKTLVTEAPATRVTEAFAVRGDDEPALQPDGTHISAEHIGQAGYPTGCESAAAVMLLRFWGVKTDMDTFIDEYLDCGDIRYVGDERIAPHPAEQFVGDPRSTAAYGCFAPVIVRAMEACLTGTKLQAIDETGATLPQLCRAYIDQGRPVAVWATMDMKPSYAGNTWTVDSTGETFTWPAREHCLLLIGYDEENYYFNDPLKETGNTAYPRALVEARFAELGKQAVGIVET